MRKYKIFSLFVLFVIIGILIGHFMPLFSTPEEARATSYDFPTSKEVAVYEWRSPSYFTSNNRDSYFAQLQSEGVSTVYLNIRAYLEVYAATTNRDSKIFNFNRQVADFIASAQKYNIKVHALAGASNWIQPTKSENIFILLNHVLMYNYKNTYKFDGFNFDIEYYTDPNYNNNQVSYATMYLDLVKRMISTIQASPVPYLRLGLSSPFWMDKVNTKSPSFYYNGATTTTTNHLLNLLSRYSRTYLAIMAYRDHYDTSDGTVALVKDELDYVRNKNYPTKIVVVQETVYSDLNFITFYNQTKQDIKFQANKITQSLVDYPQFWGFALHSADTYMPMRDY